MECQECRNKSYCSNKMAELNLSGCTSGEPFDGCIPIDATHWQMRCPFCGSMAKAYIESYGLNVLSRAVMECQEDCLAVIQTPLYYASRYDSTTNALHELSEIIKGIQSRRNLNPLETDRTTSENEWE